MAEPAANGATPGPVQVSGAVLSNKRVGDYVHLSLVAGGVAERCRPGAFVMVGVGGEESALLLSRPFWVHQARASGTYGGTVEITFTVRGPGTRWLAGLRPHDRVDVTGPLGRPFSLPREPVSCAVVGHGSGAAPLFMLTDHLLERGCAVHMLLAGDTDRSLLGTLEARRAAHTVTVVTADGKVGRRGTVSAVLPEVMGANSVDVVYACGPSGVLRDVAEVAGEAGVWSQVALESPMACGVGLCLSCVVPVRRAGEDIVPARCCVEGPVFPGDRLDWTTLGPR